MNRLGSKLVIAAVSVGLAGIGSTVIATSAGAGVDRSSDGPISALGLNVKPEKLPATGLTRAIVSIQPAEDWTSGVLNLKVRSSNPHVLTPRKITINDAKPGAFTRVRIAIQPGRKARGKTVITVTSGDLEASDSLRITRPTPGADNWKGPNWRP
jgi:hypothetical protein